jgi:hypothetical protein
LHAMMVTNTMTQPSAIRRARANRGTKLVIVSPASSAWTAPAEGRQPRRPGTSLPHD